tara:strand:- start:99 stop:590 length:492 start_codon:yes stop_codon:yes gene_type:complete
MPRVSRRNIRRIRGGAEIDSDKKEKACAGDITLSQAGVSGYASMKEFCEKCEGKKKLDSGKCVGAAKSSISNAMDKASGKGTCMKENAGIAGIRPDYVDSEADCIKKGKNFVFRPLVVGGRRRRRAGRVTRRRRTRSAGRGRSARRGRGARVTRRRRRSAGRR